MSRPRKPHATRPSFFNHGLGLEMLEDRCVPATLTVTTLVEELENNTDLSLREALQLVEFGGFSAGDTVENPDDLTVAIQGVFGDNDTIVFADDLSGGTINLGAGMGGQGVELNASFDVTIDGSSLAERIIVHANEESRHLSNTADASVTLNSLVFIGGRENGSGGSIQLGGESVLTILNCEFEDNGSTDDDGGVIGAVEFSGAVLIEDSVFRANAASDNGGAIYIGSGSLFINRSTFDGNLAGGSGGAIAHLNGNLLILDSLLVGNMSAGGGGALTTSNNYVQLVNSTFSGNLSNNDGGVFEADSADSELYIINSTLTQNQSGAGISAEFAGVTVDEEPSFESAGGALAGFYTLNIANSIIVGNTANLGDPDDLYNDNDATVSNGHNIIGVFDVATAGAFDLDQTGVDPADVLEEVLADNGGPTLTHALIDGSLALDAGNNDDAAYDQDFNAGTDPIALLADQRGFEPRIVNGTVDIGAFETGAAEPNPDATGAFSDIPERVYQSYWVTLTTDADVTPDLIEVTGGDLYSITDNGDGSFRITVTPHTPGPVTIAAPTLTDGVAVTNFLPVTIGDTNAEFVQTLYMTFFNREGSADEVAYWTNKMETLGFDRMAVIAGFFQSSEFADQFTTNDDYINAIYQFLFYRDAEDGGLQHWLNRFDELGDIEQVINEMLTSDEFLLRTIDEAYNEQLRRPYDEPGRDYWYNDVLMSFLSTIEAIRAEFAGSDEANAMT